MNYSEELKLDEVRKGGERSSEFVDSVQSLSHV